MHKTTSDIAIIGAGMAGLSCATRLGEAGRDVQLFDKGRGAGGRMASRRVELGREEVTFDHGAQYFTVRDVEFRAEVIQWQALGAIAPWPAAGEDAFIGFPAMNSPLKEMTVLQEIAWSTRIDSLERDGREWVLRAAEREHRAAKVAVAIPAEQAQQLLAKPAPQLAEIAAGATSQPCWSVMVAFAAPLDLAEDTLRASNAAIAWAARNPAKPGRGEAEAWVLHASPQRSRELLDLSPEEAGKILLADFFAQAGLAPVEPVHLAAHRWLYAMADPVAGEHARYDPDLQLGIAGDYLHSPRVEGAWISGRALAEALLDLKAA
ncbi:MAG: FAD-dependent oxidoreductase [Pseudomonadota bacterium]